MLEHIMIDWRDVLDIAIVAFLLYQIIQLLRGSRALAIVTGLGILTFLYFFSRTMGLYTLNWLLQHVFSSLFLVIVVIFQEDIRRALGEMGTKHFFHRSALKASAVEEVVSACEDMANAYIGALIVIERNMHLDDMIQREGVLVDARISSKLLKNIFYPKAPLHDGAVILSHGLPAFCPWPSPKDRISAPVTGRPSVSQRKVTPSLSWSVRNGERFPLLSGERLPGIWNRRS